MPDKIPQEWYCTKSGGGCGGYILVPINEQINGVVEMVCPKCGHKHQRCIENGVIKENGRFTCSPTQEICPTMAAWSDKPFTKAMKDRAGKAAERDGVVVTAQSDFLRQSWFDFFAAKLTGQDAS
jgi:hypothetical protein